jgi:cysteine desulfurase
MADRIYLDHAATTPLRPEVAVAMAPYLADRFGNPSSQYAEGQEAKRAIDRAREEVSEALRVDFSEIMFTSGGTEADNAALLGIMLANRKRGNHLVTSQIEHEAVLRTARFLQELGFRVTFVAPDSLGRVSPDAVAEAITDETVLVSIMHANNEVGVIQPIYDIGRIAHEMGVVFHTDAVQSFGQLSVTADALGADLISVSAHKIYGPKGSGALYVRRGLPFTPWLHGGGQERDRRSGTENVAGIVGFAEAVRLTRREQPAVGERLTTLRDLLRGGLEETVPDTVLNGHPTERLPNNVNVSIMGCESESLILALDREGVSVSTGSACSSGSIEPSHVLAAMRLAESRTKSALRLTLGRNTNESQIQRVIGLIADVSRKQRSLIA